MLKEFIAKRVSEKSFCTWTEASEAAGVKWMGPSTSNTITVKFREAMAGSDAIIVNGDGEYGRPDLPARHLGFLQANGYVKFPVFNGERAAKKAAAKAARRAKKDAVLVTSAEVAELKAQLAALVAALAK